MFFAKGSKGIDNKQLDEAPNDPDVKMALFRFAQWPYYGYPQGFIARLPGEYRVRISARAVLQQPGFLLKPATQPVPMTFRARRPSGPDVSGDVRATGGLIDILPEQATYETTIRLRERETFEYSLLGLPVRRRISMDGNRRDARLVRRQRLSRQRPAPRPGARQNLSRSVRGRIAIDQ
jgi:hypothetical protein